MKKQTSPTWQHVKLVLFALGLMELFLFFLAVIFGREVGYAAAFRACAWFGAIIIVIFAFIMLINAIMIGIEKMYGFSRTRRKKNAIKQAGP
jgi:high-affinity Fe2+/Pb2+ permease